MKMRFQLILNAALLTSTAWTHALKPRETDPVLDVNVVPHSPQITPAPHKIEIKRQASSSSSVPVGDICGYLDGDEDEIIYCAAGYACWFWPAIPLLSANLGIMTGAQNCVPALSGSSSGAITNYIPATTCENYDGANTETYAVTLSETAYCPSVEPKCATYVFEGAQASDVVHFGSAGASSSLAAQIYTHLFCSDVSTVETVLPTPT